MKALNCRLGDLAVIVRAELPENIGTVVRIVENHGLAKWSGFRRKTHIWRVETAAGGGRLVYELENGSRRIALSGFAPDAYLKPIVPLWTADADTAGAEEGCHV